MHSGCNVVVVVIVFIVVDIVLIVVIIFIIIIHTFSFGMQYIPLRSFVVYSGISLLRTLWDLKISPYYGGFLNSEITQYTTVLHWDT